MKSLISLAVVMTVIPTVHALATTPAPAPAAAEAAVALRGTPASSDEQVRRRVTRLSRQARAHARRLGLAAGRPGRLPTRSDLLERREARLEAVVGYLRSRREVGLAVDERPRRGAAPGGRTLAARVTRAHSLAAQRSVRLGLAPPAPLELARTRDGRLAQLGRWRAIASWLAARRERVRPDERPLSARVPYYDELMCIAGHEAGPEHGGWRANTGNGYYGGLQMDRGFQQTYAPAVYRAKGTADNWTQEEQMRAAGRAVASRGFTPWPNTARMCGLL